MLDAFEHWFQACRIPLEAQGFMFEFYGETSEQTIKTNNLSITYGRYEGGICVWEHSYCNIELADMKADISEPLDDCSSFVELHFNVPPKLDSALSSFCEMLVKLPNKPISARAALYGYWQGQPSDIHQ
jgi:hypothetical protein